jgi:hypothetical protein
MRSWVLPLRTASLLMSLLMSLAMMTLLDGAPRRRDENHFCPAFDMDGTGWNHTVGVVTEWRKPRYARGPFVQSVTAGFRL